MNRRSYIAVLLAFVLAFTGHSMAAARGASPAIDQMVLCIGNGSVVVYMDENGAPTSAPHICPDCTVSLLDAIVPEIAIVGVALAVSDTAPARVPDSALPNRTSSYLSRAPPALM